MLIMFVLYVIKGVKYVQIIIIYHVHNVRQQQVMLFIIYNMIVHTVHYHALMVNMRYNFKINVTNVI